MPRLPRGRQVRMELTGGRLDADTGCNEVSGTYVQDGPGGHDIRFPVRSMLTSLVGCRAKAPLFASLQDVQHVTGRGVRYLRRADGSIIAELRRSSAPLWPDSPSPQHR